MSKLSNRGRQAFGSGKQRVAYLAVAGAAVATLHQSRAGAQTYTPISLTSSSFNNDLVVEASAPQTGAAKYITASMDGGTGNLAANVWFEKGYDTALPTIGIPNAGTTFTSSNDSSHTFMMPSTYAGNDALFLGSTTGVAGTITTTTGTLTFATPGAFAGFTYLSGTGNGPNYYNVTLNYVNGTTQTIANTQAQDWFNDSTNIAYRPFGRVIPSASTSTASSFQNVNATNGPYLLQTDITGVTDTIDPVKSITFTYASGTGRTSIFALSGVSTTTINYTGTDPSTPGTLDTTSMNFSYNGSATADTYGNTANIIFDDTATGPTTISIASTNFSASTLVFNNSSKTYTLNGPGGIVGSTSVLVEGGGPVIFNQTNSYTGFTNVASGSLTVNGTLATGSLIIGAPATVTLNGTTSTSTTVGSLIGSGSLVNNVNLVIGGSGTYTGTVNGTGNLVFTGAAVFNTSANDFNFTNNAYTGTTSFNSGSNVTIFSPNSFGVSPLIFNGGGLTAGNALLTSTATSTTMSTGPIPNSFTIGNGSSAVFSGTNPFELTGTGTLTGTGGTINVATAGTVVNLTGSLVGNTLLYKTGPGTLILGSTANAISGVNVSAGILNFVSGGLGSTVSPVYVGGGGTLQFAAPNASSGYAGNSEDISTTHVLTLGSSATIDTNGNNVIFASSITGPTSGYFNKAGAGTLTFNGNVPIGYLTITGGTANAPSGVTFNGPSAALTQSGAGNGLSIGSNAGDYAVMNVGGGAKVSLAGGLNIANNANATSTVSNTDFGVLNLSGAGTVFSSALNINIGKGNGDLAGLYAIGTVNQTGGTFQVSSTSTTFQLGNNANSTGVYNLSGGTVIANTIGLTGNVGGTALFNLSGGTLIANAVNGGAGGTSTFLFNGGVVQATASSTVLFTANISSAKILAGGLLLNQGSYNVSIASNLVSGVTTGTDGGLTTYGTGTLTLSGADVFAGPIALGGPLVFSQTGTTNLSGGISGVGSLNQSGSGVTILSGNSTFTGGTTVSNGTLVLLSTTALGAPGSTVNVTGGLIGINNDAVISGYNFVFPAGTEGISFYNYSSTSLNFGTNTALKLGAVGTSSASENITGADSVTFVGPGTLALTGSNTYTGFTNVSGGTLNFQANGLGTGPVSLLGGILQFASGNTSDLTASNSSVTLGAGGGGIDTNGNNVTFAGNISGTNLGTFTKYGLGTLTLQASLKPTTLSVRGGTLFLNGSAANVSATSFTSIGLNPGDAGTLTMDNGAQYNGSTSAFSVADTSATTGGVTTGVFNLNDTTSAGTTVKVASFFVGNGSSATNGSGSAFAVGTVNQTGGLLALNNAGGTFVVGGYGTGIYNQTGGTVTAVNSSSSTATSGTTVTVTSATMTGITTATLARNAGSIGLYALTAGNLAVGNLVVGGYGAGTFTQNGGAVGGQSTVTTVTNNVSSSSPTTTSTFVNNITLAQSAGSTGIYNLNGGTVSARQISGGAGTSTFAFNGGTLNVATSSSTFITGLTNLTVGAGGATVNTNGYNVTSSVPFTTGTGALPDGGLTKLGNGTFTLSSGTGSYTGGTFINAGTLAVSSATAAGTGTVTLRGGTLSVPIQLTSTTVSGFNALNLMFNVNQTGNLAFTPNLSSNGTVLNLTSLAGSEATSAFSTGTQTFSDLGSFTATFVYNHTTGNAYGPADGISFTVQNTPSGTFTGTPYNGGSAAVGGGGGAIGYAADPNGFSITNSIASQFDIYNGRFGITTNGTNIANSTAVTYNSEYLYTGQIATIAYNGPSKTYTFTETTPTSATSTTVYTQTLTNVDIAALLGGTANGSGSGYIGFTGGTGGNTANQNVSAFSFTNSEPSAVATFSNAIVTTPGTASTVQIGVAPGSTTTNLGTLSLGNNSSLSIVTSGSTGGTVHQVGVGAVNIGAGAILSLAPSGSHSTRALFIAPAVTVAAGGSVDLSNNDADITASSLSAVTTLVANGYNYAGGGNWQGSGGITSSTAAADSSHLTALGVVQNNQGGSPLFYAASGTTPASLFDGIAPGAGDILVKYTYFGDANLDGKIDGSDYSLIDAGYASAGALTGWYNGDFNYDGVIDGSDYTLIDNAFNNQGAVLTTPTALVATETAQVAPSAVPEPASLGVLAVAAVGLVGRRRRRA